MPKSGCRHWLMKPSRSLLSSRFRSNCLNHTWRLLFKWRNKPSEFANSEQLRGVCCLSSRCSCHQYFPVYSPCPETLPCLLCVSTHTVHTEAIHCVILESNIEPPTKTVQTNIIWGSLKHREEARETNIYWYYWIIAIYWFYKTNVVIFYT